MTTNNIYYDLLQTNISNDNSGPINCSFNENKNQSFLMNPEDYKFSIVRFSIETPAIPLFIPYIQSIDPALIPSSYGNGNTLNPSDYTIYSVTIKKNASDDLSQEFVIWKTQDETKKAPTAPFYNQGGLQDNSTGYYDCFSYAWFLKVINEAFDRCVSNLNIADLVPPRIFYDSASQLFVLSASSDFYNTESDPGAYYEIYMNKALYQLFSSIPAVNTSHLKENGLNFQIMTNNYDGFSITDVPNSNGTTASSYMVYSEYSTTQLWSPISSIVFVSSNIPVTATNTSNPILSRNGTIVDNSGLPNTRKIVTDLVASDSFKPNLVYTPSAEYRYLDMVGGSPMKDIDIQVYYQDKQGLLYPLKLSSGSSASVKILFTRNF